MDRVGIHEGTIFKYHQQVDHKSEDYLKNLEQLQYDMLYGDHYAYHGLSPFKKTDIKYGAREITVDKVSYDGKDMYIEGGYYNGYSRVFINDKYYSSELLSSTLLKVKLDKEDLEEKNTVQIKQINSLDVEFRVSNSFAYKYAGFNSEESKIDDSDTGNISEDEKETKKETKKESSEKKGKRYTPTIYLT